MEGGLIAELRASGVRVALDGADIVLEAEQEPRAELLARVRTAKAELVFQLLRVADIDQWLATYTERAAIAEYDGELPRDEAERIALWGCYEAWLRRGNAL